MNAIRIAALLVMTAVVSACSVNVVVAPHAVVAVSRDAINELPAFDGYVEMADIPAE